MPWSTGGQLNRLATQSTGQRKGALVVREFGILKLEIVESIGPASERDLIRHSVVDALETCRGRELVDGSRIGFRGSQQNVYFLFDARLQVHHAISRQNRREDSATFAQ